MIEYYEDLIRRRQYKAAFLLLHIAYKCYTGGGSFTTGLNKLSKETGLHRSSVKRYLDEFMSVPLFETLINSQSRTISVLSEGSRQKSVPLSENIIYYYIDRDKKKERISVSDYYKNEIENNSGERYISLYTSFYKLLIGNPTGLPMETLLKLKPVSYVQFTKLYEKVKEINGSRVGDNKVKLSQMMESMYNNPKYTKGKVSLYLTLNNWLNLEIKRR